MIMEEHHSVCGALVCTSSASREPFAISLERTVTSAWGETSVSKAWLFHRLSSVSHSSLPWGLIIGLGPTGLFKGSVTSPCEVL